MTEEEIQSVVGFLRETCDASGRLVGGADHV